MSYIGAAAGGMTVPTYTTTQVDSLFTNLAGRVLNTVHLEYGNIFSTTSTSYVATPLTATITPSKTTSKVMVLVTYVSSAGTSTVSTSWQIRKNGVEWQPAATGQTVSNRTKSWNQYHNGDNNVTRTNTVQILDTPGTTSALEYTVYMKAQEAGKTSIMNIGYNQPDVFAYGSISSSYITLMEIAA